MPSVVCVLFRCDNTRAETSMMPSCHGNTFRIVGFLWGDSPVTEFHYKWTVVYGGASCHLFSLAWSSGSPNIVMVLLWQHSCWAIKETMLWWRHQIDTFSTLLALCAGDSPFYPQNPSKRPMARSLDVSFDMKLLIHRQTSRCRSWNLGMG